MSKQAKDRVNGPYPHGKLFRVLVIKDGQKGYRTFESEKEAWDYIAESRAKTENRDLAATIDAYLDHLRRYGGTKSNRPLRESTIATVKHRLLAILRVVGVSRPLAAITPAVARKLYAERVGKMKADTHRGELATAVAFFDWCIERDFVDRNPFADVLPEGDLSAGKPTLSTDAARRFLETAIEEKSVEGLACAAALILGLRASELVERVVEDLDDRGSVLCVPVSKTRAGVRRLRLPPRLRDLLGAYVKEQKLRPSDRLFPLSRYALHYHTLRLCKVAGVKRVTPHGLRGSMVDNAVEVGGNLDQMLPAMGWTSAAVGRRHYLSAGKEQSAQAARREASLSSKRDGVDDSEDDDGGAKYTAQRSALVNTQNDGEWGTDGVSAIDAVVRRCQVAVTGGDDTAREIVRIGRPEQSSGWKRAGNSIPRAIPKRLTSEEQVS